MSEKKERIAFFDTKPYDRVWFDQLNRHYHIKYYEHKLTPDSVSLAQGCRAVIPFVNDTLDKTVIDGLCEAGVEMIALRCAGYNNVDRQAAAGRIAVTRVPGYSPYAVAEFTMGLLLTLNRKIHKAYFRTRDFNFSLNGLVGFDLHGRTVGVIGTGKIGQIFIRICRGFGMNVVAYDPYPLPDADFPYVSLEELLQPQHDGTATDVGQHQMWVAQHYPFETPRTFISSGGLGTMGFGLGATIGAATATGKKTILVTGDGSFGMNLNELATAVTNQTPVVVFIMNNGVLGMVRQWQTLFFDKHYSNTTLERKTDFVKLAEAFGMPGYRAMNMAELKEVLPKAFAEKGPVLVDCAIDCDAFVLPMLPPGGCIDDIIVDISAM